MARILRYPVKALSHQEMRRVGIRTGQGIPGDRMFGLASGLPGGRLISLDDFPALARLDTDFDEDTGRLSLRRRGRVVVAVDLRSPLGRRVLADFFAAYLGEASVGVPRLVELAEPDRILMVGAGTLAELERLSGAPVAAETLRMNLLVSGLPPREEQTWVGDHLRIGGVRLRVSESVSRMNTVLDATLREAWGHNAIGIALETIQGGDVRIGDAVWQDGPPPPPTAEEGDRVKR